MEFGWCSEPCMQYVASLPCAKPGCCAATDPSAWVWEQEWGIEYIILKTMTELHARVAGLIWE
jgi:hypothetical protein